MINQTYFAENEEHQFLFNQFSDMRFSFFVVLLIESTAEGIQVEEVTIHNMIYLIVVILG